MISKCCIVFSLLLLLASCADKKKGVMFCPQERIHYTNDEERENAIARKRAQANSSLPDSLSTHGITLSIFAPKPNDFITEEFSSSIALKTLNIISSNGICALNGGETVFSMIVSSSTPTMKQSASLPQKTITSLTLSFYIVNQISNEIYGSYSEDFSGVGDTFQNSMMNILSSDFDKPQLKRMITSSTQRIVDWFINNDQDYKNKLDAAIFMQQYDLAFALINSVPNEASVCYNYAESKRKEVLNNYLLQKSEVYITKLKEAILKSKDSYNPEVFAFYSMIPEGNKNKEIAEKLLENYLHKIDQRTNEQIQHVRNLELEEIEIKKLQVMADIEASKAVVQHQDQPERNKTPSFFDKLLAQVVSASVPHLMSLIL